MTGYAQDGEVEITAGDIVLHGSLHLPDGAAGVTIFAHGSGSGRFSPRNRFVAAHLEKQGLGTLLFDLLTSEEERLDEGTGQFRFDIPLLADRLVSVSRWLRGLPAAKGLGVGFFGASTGAAAALIAAARLPRSTRAVVSRGGRPDLAGEFLARVEAPTLLIVGGDDPQVIELNESAKDAMRAARVELEIVPGAGHLFEGPGELEQVAELAGRWLLKALRPRRDQGVSRAQDDCRL